MKSKSLLKIFSYEKLNLEKELIRFMKIKKFFIISFVICIYLYLFITLFHIKVPELELFRDVKVEKPKRDISGIFTGQYQLKYGRYFDNKIFVRNYGIKLMNQILYNFGTVGVTYVTEVGRDNDLFMSLWSKRYFIYDFYGLDEKRGEPPIYHEANSKEIKKYIENVNTINKYMNSHNKKFIYVISPNKAEIYPENLNLRFKIINKIVTENKKSILRKEISKKLNENNITYIDSTPLMVELEKKHVKTFSKTGYHWNKVGANQITIEIIENLKKQQLELPEYRDEIKISDKVLDFRDEEAKNLINAYHVPFDSKYFDRKIIYGNIDEKRKNFFIVGSSFSDFYFDSLPFIKVKKFFYNDSYLVQTLKNDGNINQEVDFRGINNDDFEEIIRNYDVLILEHPSFALPKSHLEFAQKFSDYLRYLERNKIEEGNK